MINKTQHMRYFIVTYGCQMNKFDSMIIDGILQSMGYDKAENIYNADIVFVNGCSVRQHAVQRALGFINSLKGIVKKHAKVYITGCLAVSLKQYPRFVSGLIGLTNYKLISNIINRNDFVDLRDIEDNGNYSDIKINPGVSMFVSIIKGCNNFCSYCIVPYLRGKEHSIPFENIVKSIEKNKTDITKEIYLLGQNVNSYNYNGINFTEFLTRIAKHFPDMRIRFLTSHPKDLSNELIDAINTNDNICNTIHLPLQTASDKLLKLMHRGYTYKHYLKIIDYIRKILKEPVITTDIMVGFPYESDEDFNITMDAVKTIEFDDAFMYKFSKRQFTSAAYMKDTDEKIKLQRLKYLINIQNSIKIKKIQLLIGKRIKVLIERNSKKNENDSIGRDEGDRMIVIKGKHKIGTFVYAKVIDIKGITPIAIKEE